MGAYQSHRMRKYQTPKRLIEEIDEDENNPPRCPPTKLSLRVKKLDNPKKKIKVEPTDDSKSCLQHSTVKLKMPPGVKLIQPGLS